MPQLSPGATVAVAFPFLFGMLGLVVVLQEAVGLTASRLLGFVVVILVMSVLARPVGLTSFGVVRPRLRSVAAGVGVGAGLVVVIAMTLVAGGSYRLEWSGDGIGLGTSLLAAAAVGVFEEALFRSLWFGALEPVFGTWLTLGLSALFFGFIHAFNPHATLASSTAIALSAGLLLGGAFLVHRNLWMVSAIHAAWNATLGGVFGMPVSGGVPDGSLFDALESGPDSLSGGTFGPEASVVTIVVVGAFGAWYLVRAVRSGLIRPPIWSSSNV